MSGIWESTVIVFGLPKQETSLWVALPWNLIVRPVSGDVCSADLILFSLTFGKGQSTDGRILCVRERIQHNG